VTETHHLHSSAPTDCRHHPHTALSSQTTHTNTQAHNAWAMWQQSVK